MPFSIMPLLRDERAGLLAMGLAACAMVYTMREVLTFIRDEAQVPAEAPKSSYVTQETEDALGLETLDKLLSHPNESIREVSVKILCDRAVNDQETMNRLLWGIAQKDYELRKKCIRALDFLARQSRLVVMKSLYTPKGCSALVRSLELCTDEEPRRLLNDTEWDEYYLRDGAEQVLHNFVFELINVHPPKLLLSAGIVEKYVARQNWGEGEKERKRNFGHYVHGKFTNRLVAILMRLEASPAGNKALYRAKLMELEKRPSLDWDHEPQVYMWNENGGERDESIHRNVAGRTREHSAEEQRLRRQHREAIVMNDGTRPIGREDIINPVDL